MKYKRKILLILTLLVMLISNTAFAENNKIIYLTFDDGPSKMTDKVLDVLKENNVKATFFLIGNQICGFENTIRRIQNEGHGIGLHTYTHSFKRIYKNRSNMIDEMLQCQSIIKNVTGASPNIIRLPGGSRKHLTPSYLSELHSHNFKVYDWNMETRDGVNPKLSPNQIYKRATKGNEKLPYVMLLLHCDYMHKNTCTALPNIINYYKSQGYEFKVITEDTPELLQK